VASNGGVVGARQAAERPAFAVGSGPAAGVTGAARLGEALGEANLIVFDMGGTTAKASLVEAGKPTLTTEYEFREGISTSSRFIKAGGYMLKVPAIDIAEVGTGAGRSRGWTTVACCASGRSRRARRPGPPATARRRASDRHRRQRGRWASSNPEYLAGGELQLRAALARDAIERHVAAPAGLCGDRGRARHPRRWPTPAWRAPSARSPSSAGATRATSSSWPSEAAGPCTRATWRRRSTFAECWCRSSPGVFTAVGMLASDVEHHFVRAAGGLARRRRARRAHVRLDEIRRGAARARRRGLYGRGVRLEARPTSATRARRPSSSSRFPAGGSTRAHRRAALGLQREYAATYGYASERGARAGERARDRHRPACAPPGLSAARAATAERRRPAARVPSARRRPSTRRLRARPSRRAPCRAARSWRATTRPWCSPGARRARRLRQPAITLASASGLDPITLAVIKSALDSIVDEMAYAVIRTARSEIIQDVMDYSAALCDADGR
jgi:N-methylhydantoinase A